MAGRGGRLWPMFNHSTANSQGSNKGSKNHLWLTRRSTFEEKAEQKGPWLKTKTAQANKPPCLVPFTKVPCCDWLCILDREPCRTRLQTPPRPACRSSMAAYPPTPRLPSCVARVDWKPKRPLKRLQTWAALRFPAISGSNMETPTKH